MYITNLQRHKGTTTESITARIRHDDTSLNLCYDCLGKNLIVYRGYLMAREDLKLIISALYDFFAEIPDTLNPKERITILI